jgi:vitamin B12/bleomycin/antimicrobial peptide transport system ATP-binding/permease protein
MLVAFAIVMSVYAFYFNQMLYTQAAVIFPVIVVAPRYFAKQIGLGGLMQVVNAFSFVQNWPSFIINSYAEVAAWQAVTQRLNGFSTPLQSTEIMPPSI